MRGHRPGETISPAAHGAGVSGCPDEAFDARSAFAVRSATMGASRIALPLGLLAGLLALAALLLSAPRAAAQDNAVAAASVGEVRQIGFAGFYEPTGWIPMRVRITPPPMDAGAAAAATFRLRVHQRDLDGDRVIFERSIALVAGLGPQEFWTYFQLEPTGGDLQPAQDLRVVLADEDGRELGQLSTGRRAPLPLRGGAAVTGGSGAMPPERLVLVVGDANTGGGSFPGNREITADDTVITGLAGLTAAAPISPAELPDRAIGYDAVHAVVWQNADPSTLLEGTGDQMRALRAYVRQGGRLIVTHRSDWQSLGPILDMLPVTPLGVYDLPDITPLRSLGLNRPNGSSGMGSAEPYEEALGPFRFILATPKPNAFVESWLGSAVLPAETLERNATLLSNDRSPLLARGPYGLGCVSWLATDLGNPNVAGQPNLRTEGWASIWATLLDVGDVPILAPNDANRQRYDRTQARDFGPAYVAGTRLAGKSVALVTVALIFFIGYWLLAGPGLYFYLTTRKKAHLSWFLFGGVAAIAALLTVGLTRAILRGPPELRHISVERSGPDAPRLVMADMGLYIPRDGVQDLLVDAAGPDFATPTLSAFVPPADPLGLGLRTNPITYTVPLDPPQDDAASAVLQVPYRSTLKKLAARWPGPTQPGVTGTARLTPDSIFPSGMLTNTSGRDLRNVHAVYKSLRGGRVQTFILYVPRWPAGQGLELDKVLETENGRAGNPLRKKQGRSGPPGDQPLWGRLDLNWVAYWYGDSLLHAAMNQVPVYDDYDRPNGFSPIVLSLFSMLPPMENVAGSSTNRATVLLRRGAAEWDASAAVTAGNLLVIGEADDQPLPLPLSVNNRPVTGKGRVIGQYVVPLDRSAMAETATDDDAE